MFLINMLNTWHSKINFQCQSGYGKDLFLFVSNTLMSAENRKQMWKAQCKFTAKKEKGVRRNFKTYF